MINKEILIEFNRQLINADCELKIEYDRTGVLVVDKDELLVMSIFGENTLYINGNGNNFRISPIDENRYSILEASPHGYGIFIFSKEKIKNTMI